MILEKEKIDCKGKILQRIRSIFKGRPVPALRHVGYVVVLNDEVPEVVLVSATAK